MIELIKFILAIFNSKGSEPIQTPLIKKEEIKMPGKVKHLNTGNCLKCEELFNKFPGFHEGLKNWFKEIQKKNPEAHISCAGRGKADQEEFFLKGTSKAHYGQSSHNFNAALDIMRITINGAEWEKNWFISIIEPELDSYNNKSPDIQIKWYGKPGSPYFELPHFELSNWRDLVKNNKLTLVE